MNTRTVVFPSSVAWLPDRPPTWGDVVAAILAVPLVGLQLVTFEGLVTPAAAVGAVAALVTLGPVAATTGRCGEGWVQAIGRRGRVVVIGACIVSLWLVFTRVPALGELLASAGLGVLVGTTVFVVVHVLATGEISGTRPS